MMRRIWEVPLSTLDPQEWEALCDGCGKCCHNETVAGRDSTPCPLLSSSGLCSDYTHRFERIPSCRKVTMRYIEVGQLPATCAYVRRYNGMPLEQWQIERIRGATEPEN